MISCLLCANGIIAAARRQETTDWKCHYKHGHKSHNSVGVGLSAYLLIECDFAFSRECGVSYSACLIPQVFIRHLSFKYWKYSDALKIKKCHISLKKSYHQRVISRKSLCPANCDRTNYFCTFHARKTIAIKNLHYAF